MAYTLSSIFASLVQVVVLFLASIFSLFVVIWELLTSPCCSRGQPSNIRNPTSILITGATSGIGEALAIRYAKPGATIAISGRNAAALEATKAACEKKGAKVLAHRGDVTDKEALAAWIRTVDKQAPLDLVIANAGVTEATSGAAGTTGNVAGSNAALEAAARAVMDINVTGVLNTIFPALEGMRTRGKGQVALVASLAGFGAISAFPSYSASKAAVRVLGEALRGQLYREGVRVNVITPGYVKSPMTDANKFPQPGMVSMDFAVSRIVRGLANDEPVVAFPLSTFVGAWLLGALPPVVKDFVARNRLIGNVAYWRKKKTEAGNKKEL
jgi:NAD(P)-dependent dehydrogenase (short-subunit alcohol dehydrogenase family)